MRRALTGVLFAVLALTLLPSPVVTAGPAGIFTRQFGTAAIEYAGGMTILGSEMYLVGTTYGVFPGQTAAGLGDVFLTTLNLGGNPTGTQQFGTSENDWPTGVAADASGIYVAGTTAGSFPGESNSGLTDAFIRKHNPGGTAMWTHEFGSADEDFATGVSVAGTGVYVMGTTAGALPGQTNLGNEDCFLRRYDTQGNETWTRQFGTSSTENAGGVFATASGVYVVGYTFGALPGQTSNGLSDAFLRKYDAQGNEVWTRQFGSSVYDQASSVSVDDSGIYVSGITTGVLPGQSNAGGTDLFLRKYDLQGNEVWTREFGTSASSDTMAGVSAAPSGVYVAGFTDGTFAGQTSAGGNDAFVRKYDAAGSLAWGFQFGTAGTDTLSGLAGDASGAYLAGTTDGTFPGQTSAGASDAFVRKYDGRPPTIAVPPNVEKDATSAGGAAVAYEASAVDDTDGPVPVACTSPSGSVFPLGATTVECRATDTTGNTATATFVVTVRTPPPWGLIAIGIASALVVVIAVLFLVARKRKRQPQ